MQVVLTGSNCKAPALPLVAPCLGGGWVGSVSIHQTRKVRPREGESGHPLSMPHFQISSHRRGPWEGKHGQVPPGTQTATKATCCVAQQTTQAEKPMSGHPGAPSSSQPLGPGKVQSSPPLAAKRIPQEKTPAPLLSCCVAPGTFYHHSVPQFPPLTGLL